MNPSVATGFLACLMGCGADVPPCSDQNRFIAAVSAGCLIQGDAGTLLVRDWRGQLALPGGSVARDESAHCGAEREVFEETGMSVVAGQVATVFGNGFHLFRCHAAPGAEPHILRPIEIKEVGWWRPDRVAEAEWRYPGQGAVITELLAAETATTHPAQMQPIAKFPQEKGDD